MDRTRRRVLLERQLTDISHRIIALGPKPLPPTSRPGNVGRRASHGWLVRCSATCKARGDRCRKWAMAGRTTCRAHGGASYRRRGLQVAEVARIQAYVGAYVAWEMCLADLAREWRALERRLDYIDSQPPPTLPPKCDVLPS